MRDSSPTEDEREHEQRGQRCLTGKITRDVMCGPRAARGRRRCRRARATRRARLLCVLSNLFCFFIDVLLRSCTSGRSTCMRRASVITHTHIHHCTRRARAAAGAAAMSGRRVFAMRAYPRAHCDCVLNTQDSATSTRPTLITITPSDHASDRREPPSTQESLTLIHAVLAGAFALSLALSIDRASWACCSAPLRHSSHRVCLHGPPCALTTQGGPSMNAAVTWCCVLVGRPAPPSAHLLCFRSSRYAATPIAPPTSGPRV